MKKRQVDEAYILQGCVFVCVCVRTSTTCLQFTVGVHPRFTHTHVLLDGLALYSVALVDKTEADMPNPS
jgi:hypothetical protein